MATEVRSRVPVKRLIPRTRTFNGVGSSLWTASDVEVSKLEKLIAAADKALGPHKHEIDEFRAWSEYRRLRGDFPE